MYAREEIDYISTDISTNMTNITTECEPRLAEAIFFVPFRLYNY